MKLLSKNLFTNTILYVMQNSIIGMKAPIIMVLIKATPTSPYQLLLKSVYWPTNILLSPGILNSLRLALKSKRRMAVLKNSVTKIPILIDRDYADFSSSHMAVIKAINIIFKITLIMLIDNDTMIPYTLAV